MLTIELVYPIAKENSKPFHVIRGNETFEFEHSDMYTLEIVSSVYLY